MATLILILVPPIMGTVQNNVQYVERLSPQVIVLLLVIYGTTGAILTEVELQIIHSRFGNVTM